jgi:hypothetical protein
MLPEFLSTIFDFNQFTGFEHVRITTLLAVLGLISIGIWIIIAVSLVVRHLATFILRSFSYSHSHTPKVAGKNHDR